MYSRETYERGLRIPPRYSGTAFGKDNDLMRDAVGRPSVLPEEKTYREIPAPSIKNEIIKAPPPKSFDIEKEETTKVSKENITKNYSDEIIIGALIFSLISSGKGGEEDITLLLLLLLLIL
jgi:hypothetical protein